MRAIPAGFVLGVTCAMFGACSDATQPRVKDSSEGDLAEKEVEAEVTPVVCEPDWLKWVSPTVYTEPGPSEFTRPYFTMCENGEIRWDGWEKYDRYHNDSLNFLDYASVIPCPGGECKWGLCKEDADYLEALTKTMGNPVKAQLRMENAYCNTCNINNVMYFSAPESFDIIYWCDYSPTCCDAQFGWPCDNRQWGWLVVVSDDLPEHKTGFTFSAYESHYAITGDPCLESNEFVCGPEHNASCVPGTASLYQSEWRSEDTIRPTWGVASLTMNGVIHTADYAAVTIGDYASGTNINGTFALPECDPSLKRPHHGGSYFSCSGTAVLHTKEDKWMRVVWLYKYDRNKCSKPCWMATEKDGLEVEFYVQELAGKPDA